MSDDMEEFCNTVGSSNSESKSHGRFVESAEMPVDEHRRQANGTMWAVNGDTFLPCDETQQVLPPGQYISRFSDHNGVYFVKKNVNLDTLIELPDNNSDKVLDSMNDFWTKEDKFREFGFLWKRGIMLWGPPGSGKTSTVQRLSKQIIDLGGISLYCTVPGNDAEALRILRKIEPTRPLVVIIEDIDAVLRDYGESNLLAMLDGELQIDNVVFVATTNYPERLDKRLINRPSRFDEVIKIGMPNAKCREVYLVTKNPRLLKDDKELEMWVEKTENFSIAHLKELVASVECLGHPAEEAISRLRTMNSITISSDDDSNTKFKGFVSQ